MKEDILKMARGLDNDTLKEFNEVVAGEVERRRPKPTLDTIRPGMSKEDEAAVIAEIIRVRNQ